MKRRLYLCVTMDKYELPVAVADTQKELADMLGIQEYTVTRALFDQRRGLRKKTKYREVWIDD